MSTKSAYETCDYKDLLKDALLARKATVSKAFTFQAMAKACRVQKTYLSRVFNGDAHLNDDQVFLAAEFLGLAPDERHYLNLLHQNARSVVPQKKRVLERELAALRKKHTMSEGHLDARTQPLGTADAHDFAGYYLEPELQALHMFLTIDRFARDPAKLRHQMGLTEAEFARLLNKLIELGLVAFKDGRYEVLKQAVHLSPESPVFKPYRTMLRLKAMERAARLPKEESYLFSVLFSADDATRKKVQAKFLDFLKSIEKDVQAAPPEDVFYLSFDLMKWMP